MKRNQLTLLGLVAALVMTFSMVGCGTGDLVGNAVKKANKTNVARVANAYAMYQMRNNYKGPKDEAALKAFMNENSDVMANMGIDDVDAVFISDRDDEPIKIRWGVPGSSRGCYEPIAFETTGSGGSRLVGFASGVQEEVDDDTTYDSMLAGTYKPAVDRTDSKGGGIPKYDKNGKQIN